ncbi:DNA polymerase III subunit alpha [Spiroplasma corruscae]|uniref:DNA-directed DNA polymerase n=1 Tax=Spiroplasma corruscae TaxID=216934 RepID=A0A222ENS1_9MOLU|nr:DNA polymerase III subunit alpha [Spiroplasma corruscae]ASP27934.1 DNA polymerase III subunit alpha [Spiroplasma corruscae]
MNYKAIIGVQTCYNFLDSTIKVNDYVSFLKESNINVGFYADENVMYGAYEFFDACNKNNIKPIIGLKVAINDSLLYIYAKNNKGYISLIKLSTFIQETLEGNKSFILEDIQSYVNDNHIIVLQTDEISFINTFTKKIDENDIFFSASSICVSNKNKIIYTNKICYLNKESFEVYKALKALKNGITYKEVNDQNNYYYQTIEEIKDIVDIKNHDYNIQYIIDNVDDDVITNNDKHFLKYPNSMKMPSDSYLRFICEESLELYLNDIEDNKRSIYTNRLEYELETIYSMGFSDYFLIVHDLIKKSVELGILYGPGRGSAAGSLVAYLLKITKVDPIKWNLIFERFLNIERITLPDIDIDFQDDRREELIEYLFEKYGKYHFATITTFQTIGVKNALRDCGRVLEIPLLDINDMTKSISNEDMLNMEAALLNSVKLYNYSLKYPKLFQVAKNIVGLPRQSGTHAAGVVFCDKLMNEVVPLKVGINGILQTQYPMNYLERIGLIKTDILGLRNLTILQDILTLINKNTNENLALENIDLNDEMTFNTLNKGDTLGVFQLESKGMTNLLVSMKVKSIDDIAITSALYRPGPQDNIQEFLNRKNNKIKKWNVNEKLKGILENTYGVIVYQEQILEILKTVSKMSYSRADIVRRAISKKDQNLLHTERESFINSAKNNDYSESESIELWNYIEKFANYGFNKSHSVSYSFISYWMAYLKTHYKLYFYCALLNGVIRNEEKTKQYLKEVKKDKYIIKPPTIKNLSSNFVIKNNVLHIPLTVIKYIGPEFIRKIKESYLNNKRIFENLLTLLYSLNQSTLTEQKYLALVYSGAFDCFGISRKALIDYKEEIFNLIKSYKSLDNYNLSIDIPNVQFSNEEILCYEKEYIGFFISSNPIIDLRKKFKNNNLSKIESIVLPDTQVNIIALVENIVIKFDKNNKEMAFVRCSDETESLEFSIFSSVYGSIKDKIIKGKYYIFTLRTQFYKENLSFSFVNVINQLN